jgi:VanZ family protein
MTWLRWWWPAVVWAGLIALFSTDSFSTENTRRFIVPILHWIFPVLQHRTLIFLHHLIRKGAHVGEYALFSMLALYGIRGPGRGWRMEWAVWAVALSAGWAGLDELHQAFVPSRGPSMLDVLIDTCGAVAGQMVVAAVSLVRSRGAAAVYSESRVSAPKSGGRT